MCGHAVQLVRRYFDAMDIIRFTRLAVGLGLVLGMLMASEGVLAASSGGGTAGKRGRPVLKTEGLTNHALITKIFEGDFVNIYMDRSDDLFGVLLNQYLQAFGRQCAGALPKNKVELTTQRCTTESVTRNGYGVEISRSCVEWETVGTGVYAKPAMRDALTTVSRQNAADAGRKISQALGRAGQPGGLSQMGRLVGDAQAITNDMQQLVNLNGCSSPGLERFEENLRRFAVNGQPIALNPDKAEASINNPPAGQAFKDQDYRKLIEDLILDDTKRWGAFARFVPGSVTSASVESRDGKGRPARAAAPYMWEGIMGKKQGKATLTFKEGIPECLIYSETPSVCHSANRQISARYLRGEYGR